MAQKSTTRLDPEALTDFGAESIRAGDKAGRVRDVFDSVAPSYDVMNDVMSLGIHRLWKDRLMRMIAPTAGQNLVDLAGGTGDMASRFLGAGGERAVIVDINRAMMDVGMRRRHIAALDGLCWVAGDAERIPLADGCADIVLIAFGLRNITDRPAALGEARRILKPGGMFYCLEFSAVRTRPLRLLYGLWSEALPGFGSLIARDRGSYQYLIESIRRFPDQEELAAMLAAAGFARVRHIDLSGGIAAIHRGQKVD